MTESPKGPEQRSIRSARFYTALPSEPRAKSRPEQIDGTPRGGAAIINEVRKALILQLPE